MPERHIVLGAGGAIASATVKALQATGVDVIAIGRSDADVRDAAALAPHLVGASHVYLCIGLPYVGAVWERDWPVIMRAVLSACEAAGARLIFFDNVYMYGPPPLANPITEDHQQTPTTRKGRARKAVADLALQAHAAGRVRVVIGRSADFYGPGAINSPFYIQFLENLLAGKPPQTLMPQGPRHTYAYTLDNGRALVRLALDDVAYGAVWHLPVGPAVTVEEMADHFRAVLGRDFKVAHLPPFIISLLGLFNSTIREVAEMGYQFRDDYVLDWSRFAARYPDFTPTPYAEGVKSMVDFFHSREA
ncbi:NAD-dependent epimerase/dehydratase family protein [Tabrizicola sp. TH137]|uniref:NAD-dependent epimerase/dehydratase family protein n=1 Tax=Tabrizicola sp. TH137 TaxID=2067452 RepID=UPI0013044EBD|nr:NAD-dependent epimerase/dehydratase family protein [Tabrizicola sp. TH137]